jgi:hypothetical protein
VLLGAVFVLPEMANGRMPQGGGGSASTTAAAASRKRRADALSPVATADVPAHGIMLPAGAVSGLAFLGGPVVKEKASSGWTRPSKRWVAKQWSARWLASLMHAEVLSLLLPQLVAMPAVATVGS